MREDEINNVNTNYFLKATGRISAERLKLAIDAAKRDAKAYIKELEKEGKVPYKQKVKDEVMETMVENAFLEGSITPKEAQAYMEAFTKCFYEGSAGNSEYEM
ncbi:MAG: hypothetical protein KGJ93_03960 [Patescibacteria group bacterium]|nr:hypothetical protein [Patescibacteria group bacterium]